MSHETAAKGAPAFEGRLRTLAKRPDVVSPNAARMKRVVSSGISAEAVARQLKDKPAGRSNVQPSRESRHAVTD